MTRPPAATELSTPAATAPSASPALSSRRLLDPAVADGFTLRRPPVRTRPLFVNPICEGADPWVTRHGDEYFFCQTEGHDGISVWRSRRLTDRGIKRVVWRPQPGAWNSRDIWAPELHRLDGRWYIYYTACDGRNENHRAGVLAALTDDPQGPYEERGILYTGDHIDTGELNRWAIDATPLQIDDRLYLVWSGWPDGGDLQYLYIAPMKNPRTVAGNRVKLCENDCYLWERVRESRHQRGLHEGPQVLRRHGRIFIIYSCSSSWHVTYKLNMLYMDETADPLDPRSWVKSSRPVLQSTADVFGIGHASFTTSPDGTQDWILFHAKRSRKPGWERAVFLQPFTWTPEGFPDFGTPLPEGTVLEAPSGEDTNTAGGRFRDAFSDESWDRWIYYGHTRYIAIDRGRLNLGRRPGAGAVNLYRCGEKALVRSYDWGDCSLRTRVRIRSGRREAGVLFRVQQPALGYHAQKGYFVSLLADQNRLVLGWSDGRQSHEIGSAGCPLRSGRWYGVRVDALGDSLRVYLDDEMMLAARDNRFASGMAGVRVVDTHAEFDDFEISPA